MIRYKIVYPISETFVHLYRLAIIIVILSIYFFATQTEFFKALEQKYTGLGIIFWLSLCVIGTFSSLVLVAPKKLGTIILTEDEITIKVNKSQHIYPLSLLTSIEIISDFLEEDYGMSNNSLWNSKPRGAFARDIFTNNWLSFYYQNDFHSYQFEIGSLFSQQKMLDMMKKWRAKNINFSYR